MLADAHISSLATCGQIRTVSLCIFGVREDLGLGTQM